MEFIRLLLFPFSVAYGLIVFIRNKLYDWGVLESTQFDLPVISVGNLSAGGTGKTPHIEYLIRLLGKDYKLATLSRGYGRKTTGFLLADEKATAPEIGDEPLQFNKKFKNITVAVDEKRVHGIQQLLEKKPETEAILLDDAFQHRAVKPGLSIVLTDFRNLYFNDNMLPTGHLREFRSGIKRADIIVVSKCPTILVPVERKRILGKINPLPHQSVYFSNIEYGEIISLNTGKINPVSKIYYAENNYSILMVTGIANTAALEQYLRTYVKNVIPLRFADHHQYTPKDFETIKNKFENIPDKNKIILTTEKDAMRLRTPEFMALLKPLPIFYMPIEIEFFEEDKKQFDEQIVNYVRKN